MDILKEISLNVLLAGFFCKKRKSIIYAKNAKMDLYISKPYLFFKNNKYRLLSLCPFNDRLI